MRAKYIVNSWVARVSEPAIVFALVLCLIATEFSPSAGPWEIHASFICSPSSTHIANAVSQIPCCVTAGSESLQIRSWHSVASHCS
ncbi:hypothetical protein AG1IA_06410 [Rhizoctonia solani AG-1 IA]|uniref:Uncharacterized protein n=1 Tax=Thanatephorus cucumeris (strain AG1-IA) TaxID=983506 RepID=L8WT48_THACA|nr:hypothetical protein AG1IA_06410 [Rhizoctonia solani AG-1 IA]